jgi:hypothetical protein
MIKHPGVNYHRMAAEHHEKAALHHKKAADYYEAGNIQKAIIHADLAALYHRHANEHVFNKQEERVEHHHEQFYS